MSTSYAGQVDLLRVKGYDLSLSYPPPVRIPTNRCSVIDNTVDFIKSSLTVQNLAAKEGYDIIWRGTRPTINLPTLP